MSNPSKDQMPEIPRIYIGHINLQSLDQFRRQFLKLEQDDNIPMICLNVSSYGGDLLAAFGFISLMETCQKTIFTIVDSVAASAGALIFAAGHERFVSPYAHLMVHQVSHAAIGKIADTKADVQFTDTLNEKMFRLLDKFAKKKQGYFAGEVRKRGNTDWWLDCYEAKKIGMATQISVPKFLIEPNVNFHVIGAQTEEQAAEEEKKTVARRQKRKDKREIKKSIDKKSKQE